MAKWQLAVAQGHLQALKDAHTECSAVLDEPIPTDITFEAASERSRMLYSASDASDRAYVQLARHMCDKVAPLLGFDTEQVATMRRDWMNHPAWKAAEELEG